jgi:alpha-ribazole phosphatase/probable phosphoglycerate mutase
MSDLLFIRHAETDRAGTFCGHLNPGLNARGLLQLEELLRRIHREDIGAVYTSDLLRARTTAGAVAEAFAVKFHVSSALREIGFGEWEGLTWEQVEKRDSAYSRRWVMEYPDLPTPGGENFHDFEQRVLAEVRSLSKEAERRHCSIAVVTHAGVLRTVLTKVQGYSQELAWEHTKSYCSLVRLSNADAVLTSR